MSTWYDQPETLEPESVVGLDDGPRSDVDEYKGEPREEVVGLDVDEPEVSFTSYTIKGSDGEVEVSSEQAMLSKMLKSAIDMSGGEENETTVNYPVSLLKHLVKYFELVKEENNGKDIDILPKPLYTSNFAEVSELDGTPKLREWIDTFADKHSKDELYKFLEVLNFFDVPGALHAFAAKVSTWIKGKKLEEIADSLS